MTDELKPLLDKLPRVQVGAGLHDLTHDQYHGDPCPEPSLSASIAKILLDRSPAHAWHEHSRLNPNVDRSHSKILDRGELAHAVLLHEDRSLVVVEAADWRTNSAKAERYAAYAAGKIPVLAGKLPEVRAMVEACFAQLEQHECKGAFVGGLAEQTLIWKEGDVWCRARQDWMPHRQDIGDGVALYDYKTTEASANPHAFVRTFYGCGYDFRAAWYARGIKAVLGIEEPAVRFVVQEVSPPYKIAVFQLTPYAMSYAMDRVERAIKLWDKCLQSNDWPGYPDQVFHIDPPPYLVAAFEEFGQ